MQVAHRPAFAALDDAETDAVKDAKWKLWKKSGRLTHSDAALWASKVIEHVDLGPVLRREIVRRFPLIIVDELQDTGYFLGKCIRTLLSETNVRAVLVGDPDQAIFEFNGARPELFEGFQAIGGAQTLPLTRSWRCPKAVAAAAEHLKHSGGTIQPAENETGRAVLLRYDDMEIDVAHLVDAITAIAGNRSVKVIARALSCVQRLTGCKTTTAKKLGSPPLNHMQRSVALFRQGRNGAALAAARAALDYAVFQSEDVGDDILSANNIDPQEWRACAIECLLAASSLPTLCDLHTWQTQVGGILDVRLLQVLAVSPLAFTPGTIKPKKNAGWSSPSSACFPQPLASASSRPNASVQTVHAVKGETHDLTVFVCPPMNGPSTCQSAIWWSQDPEDHEEKRIAYVAMTRLTRRSARVCFSGMLPKVVRIQNALCQ